MSLWRRIFTERRALVLPLVTVLVINVLVLALAVFPLQRSVAGDETRATDVKLALADAMRAERVANDTKASKQRADDELKRFYAEVLPSSLAEARSLLYYDISQLARENGLVHASSNFESEPVEKSSLLRFSVDVALTGSYSNIRKFVYDLETAEGFYVIESVKLAQPRAEGNASGLEVVLQVATYHAGVPR
jgi:Tfp pilus assembly protein PilO